MDITLLTGRFPQLSETFIYRKAVALAERGHHVTVAAREQGDWSLYPQPLPPTLSIEALPADHSLRSPSRAMAALAQGARHLIRAPRGIAELVQRLNADARQVLRHAPFVGRRTDVLHFEFLGLGTMYPLAGDLTGAATVVSCRGSDVHLLPLRPQRERDAHLECLRRVDAIHCVSDELADCVERLLGSRDRIWVNRAALDLTQITPRTHEPTRRVKIIASGRLVWIKGYDYLFTALARLAQLGIDFHADIIGDGELRKELAFSIRDLGLDDRVTLVGALAPAEAIIRLRDADIFVLSSLDEGISNSAIEAMATGLPVVSTRAGGMPEAISDGVEGFLVPIRDATALADRLAQLARDPALRATMGRAARAKAESTFSLPRQIDTFEAIYRSIARAT